MRDIVVELRVGTERATRRTAASIGRRTSLGSRTPSYSCPRWSVLTVASKVSPNWPDRPNDQEVEVADDAPIGVEQLFLSRAQG